MNSGCGQEQAASANTLCQALSVNELALAERVRTLSFNLPAGALTVLVGPNGAGKSSILKLLAGVESADSGTAFLGPLDLLRCSARARAAQVGYVAQAVLPNPYTVAEFLEMGFYALERSIRPQELGAVVSLLGGETFLCRPLSLLSSGEQQLVMIAAALIHQPQLVLLDEPASFLDPHHQQSLNRTLQQIVASKKHTLLMVTHDLNHPLFEKAAQVLALKQGSLFYSGSVDSFFEPDLLAQLFETHFQCQPCVGRRLPLLYTYSA
jgi:ABC-type cobalamin/Fe3+-siderophores transport system ATPase subunit